jgi:hypothetical protein
MKINIPWIHNIESSADLKNKYLDFAKQHGWKESGNSVFRVNTAEGYEALNLKSNGKNKQKILVTVTQSAPNVPQTNNTSTSGMNEE